VAFNFHASHREHFAELSTAPKPTAAADGDIPLRFWESSPQQYSNRVRYTDGNKPFRRGRLQASNQVLAAQAGIDEHDYHAGSE
jgi:hypothetical protein